MKTMTKLALLLLAVAAGSSAQAQTKKLPAGVAYTIESKSAAVGTDISYQWYRNGKPISGAADTSYTVPAGLATGYNVQFKRGVKSASCEGDMVFSNTVTLTFCRLLLNGVCWADANVAQPGTFAERPDMYTEFYQWNRPDKAWAATGGISGWTTTSITDAAWVSDPCPEGWRLPTQAEFSALANSGYFWVSSGVKGAAVAGGFFGPNTNSCSFSSSMTNCIFLPAVGYREYTDHGMLTSPGARGLYWSSMQFDSTHSYSLNFTSSSSSSSPHYDKAYGFTVRCVQ